MTGLRWSVRAIVCVLIGVPLALIFLVGLAVIGQLLAWWIS